MAAREVRMKTSSVARSLFACALICACGWFAGLQAAAEKKGKAAPKVSPAARVVLENAVAAMGGEAALARVRALRLSAKGTRASGAMKEDYTSEMVLSMSNELFLTMESPSFKCALGVGNTEAWTAMMAPPARADGPLKKSLREWRFWQRARLVRPLLDLGGSVVEGGEKETVDGKIVQCVRVTLWDGRTYRLTFTAGDKPLLAGIEGDMLLWDGRKGLVKSRFSHHRVFGTITYPGVIEEETSVEGKAVETVREEIVAIEWNPRISRDTFAIPKTDLQLMTPSTKNAPAFNALAIVHAGPYEAMGATMEKLEAAAGAVGLMGVGPMATIYLNDPSAVKDPKDLRTEILLALKVPSGAPLTLPAGITLKDIPAAEVASMTARGPYGQADVAALRQLFAWLGAAGHTVVGAPRILYFHEPGCFVAEDLVSEVQIPIKKKS